MCLGIAGQVLEVLPHSKDLARVNVFGAERTINVGLLAKDGLRPGEWVLIHVGFAIAKMTDEEARASMDFLEAMGAAFIHEITAAREDGADGEVAAPALTQRKNVS